MQPLFNNINLSLHPIREPLSAFGKNPIENELEKAKEEIRSRAKLHSRAWFDSSQFAQEIGDTFIEGSGLEGGKTFKNAADWKKFLEIEEGDLLLPHRLSQKEKETALCDFQDLIDTSLDSPSNKHLLNATSGPKTLREKWKKGLYDRGKFVLSAITSGTTAYDAGHAFAIIFRKREDQKIICHIVNKGQGIDRHETEAIKGKRKYLYRYYPILLDSPETLDEYFFDRIVAYSQPSSEYNSERSYSPWQIYRHLERYGKIVREGKTLPEESATPSRSGKCPLDACRLTLRDHLLHTGPLDQQFSHYKRCVLSKKTEELFNFYSYLINDDRGPFLNDQSKRSFLRLGRDSLRAYALPLLKGEERKILSDQELLLCHALSQLLAEKFKEFEKTLGPIPSDIELPKLPPQHSAAKAITSIDWNEPNNRLLFLPQNAYLKPEAFWLDKKDFKKKIVNFIQDIRLRKIEDFDRVHALHAFLYHMPLPTDRFWDSPRSAEAVLANLLELSEALSDWITQDGSILLKSSGLFQWFLLDQVTLYGIILRLSDQVPKLKMRNFRPPPIKMYIPKNCFFQTYDETERWEAICSSIKELEEKKRESTALGLWQIDKESRGRVDLQKLIDDYRSHSENASAKHIAYFLQFLPKETPLTPQNIAKLFDTQDGPCLPSLYFSLESCYHRTQCITLYNNNFSESGLRTTLARSQSKNLQGRVRENSGEYFYLPPYLGILSFAHHPYRTAKFQDPTLEGLLLTPLTPSDTENKIMVSQNQPGDAQDCSVYHLFSKMMAEKNLTLSGVLSLCEEHPSLLDDPSNRQAVEILFLSDGISFVKRIDDEPRLIPRIFAILETHIQRNLINKKVDQTLFWIRLGIHLETYFRTRDTEQTQPRVNRLVGFLETLQETVRDEVDPQTGWSLWDRDIALHKTYVLALSRTTESTKISLLIQSWLESQYAFISNKNISPSWMSYEVAQILWEVNYFSQTPDGSSHEKAVEKGIEQFFTTIKQEDSSATWKIRFVEKPIIHITLNEEDAFAIDLRSGIVTKNQKRLQQEALPRSRLTSYENSLVQKVAKELIAVGKKRWETADKRFHISFSENENDVCISQESSWGGKRERYLYQRKKSITLPLKHPLQENTFLWLKETQNEENGEGMLVNEKNQPLAKVVDGGKTFYRVTREGALCQPLETAFLFDQNSSYDLWIKEYSPLEKTLFWVNSDGEIQSIISPPNENNFVLSFDEKRNIHGNILGAHYILAKRQDRALLNGLSSALLFESAKPGEPRQFILPCHELDPIHGFYRGNRLTITHEFLLPPEKEENAYYTYRVDETQQRLIPSSDEAALYLLYLFFTQRDYENVEKHLLFLESADSFTDREMKLLKKIFFLSHFDSHPIAIALYCRLAVDVKSGTLSGQIGEEIFSDIFRKYCALISEHSYSQIPQHLQLTKRERTELLALFGLPEEPKEVVYEENECTEIEEEIDLWMSEQITSYYDVSINKKKSLEFSLVGPRNGEEILNRSSYAFFLKILNDLDKNEKRIDDNLFQLFLQRKSLSLRNRNLLLFLLLIRKQPQKFRELWNQNGEIPPSGEETTKWVIEHTPLPHKIRIWFDRQVKNFSLEESQNGDSNSFRPFLEKILKRDPLKIRNKIFKVSRESKEYINEKKKNKNSYVISFLALLHKDSFLALLEKNPSKEDIEDWVRSKYERLDKEETRPNSSYPIVPLQGLKKKIQTKLWTPYQKALTLSEPLPANDPFSSIRTLFFQKPEAQTILPKGREAFALDSHVEEEHDPLAQSLLEQVRRAHEKENRKKESLLHSLQEGKNLKELSKDLQTIIDNVESTRKELENQIVATANRGDLLHQIRQRGGQTQTLTLHDIILQPNHPQIQSLTQPEKNVLFEATIKYMELSTLIDQANRAKETADANRIQEAGEILHQKRTYDPLRYPELLLYEYFSGNFLRKEPDQAALLIKIFDTVFSEIPQKEKERIVKQLLVEFEAGGGKTKVLSTILALKAIREGKHPVFFSLPDLEDVTKIDLRESLVQLFRVRIHFIKLQLDDDPSVESLKSIYKGLQAAIEEEKCSLMIPETWHALHLNYKLALFLDDKKRLKYLRKILNLLREKGVFFIDESHINLDPLLLANIALGREIRLPKSHQDLYLDVWKALIGIGKDSLESDEGPLPKDFLGIRNNEQTTRSKNYAKKLPDILARYFVKHKIAEALTDEQRKKYLTFLKELDEPAPPWMHEMYAKEGLEHLHAKKLALAKGMIHLYIPHALGLDNILDYGPSPRADQFFYYPRIKKQVTTAKYHTVDVTSSITTQGHFQSGLGENEIKTLCIDFVKSYEQQKKRRYKNEEIEEFMLLQKWQKDLPLTEYIGLDQLARKKTIGVEEIQNLMNRIGKNIEVIEYFLLSYSLPQITSSSQQISSSAADLFGYGSSLSITLSATPGFNERYSHIFDPKKQALRDPAFLAKVIQRSCEPENRETCVVQARSPSALYEEIYQEKREAFNELEGLINVGGFAHEKSSYELAQEFLAFVRTHEELDYDGVVYFKSSINAKTKKTEKVLFLLKRGREGKEDVEFRLSGSNLKDELAKHHVRLERIFKLYDINETTGTDLLLSPSAKMLLTLGESVSAFSLAQGYMRMRRGLVRSKNPENSQRVLWVIPATLHKQMKKDLGTKKNESLTQERIWQWAIRKEANKQRESILANAEQEIAHLFWVAICEAIESAEEDRQRELVQKHKKALVKEIERDPFQLFGFGSKEIETGDYLDHFAKKLSCEWNWPISPDLRKTIDRVIRQTRKVVPKIVTGHSQINETVQQKEKKQHVEQELLKEAVKENRGGRQEADHYDYAKSSLALSTTGLLKPEKHSDVAFVNLLYGTDFFPHNLFSLRNAFETLRNEKQPIHYKPIHHVLLIEEKSAEGEKKWKAFCVSLCDAGAYLQQLLDGDLNPSLRAALFSPLGHVIQNGKGSKGLKEKDLTGIAHGEIPEIREIFNAVALLNGQVKEKEYIEKIFLQNPEKFQLLWERIVQGSIDTPLLSRSDIDSLVREAAAKAKIELTTDRAKPSRDLLLMQQKKQRLKERKEESVTACQNIQTNILWQRDKVKSCLDDLMKCEKDILKIYQMIMNEPEKMKKTLVQIRSLGKKSERPIDTQDLEELIASVEKEIVPRAEELLKSFKNSSPIPQESEKNGDPFSSIELKQPSLLAVDALFSKQDFEEMENHWDTALEAVEQHEEYQSQCKKLGDAAIEWRDREEKRLGREEERLKAFENRFGQLTEQLCSSFLENFEKKIEPFRDELYRMENEEERSIF